MNGIEAGKAYVKFLLDDKDLKKSLATVGAKLQAVGKVGAAAGGAMVGAFAGATAAFIEAGSKLDDLAQRSGISGEAMSGLSFAANQTGTEIETLASGVAKMQKNIAAAADGNGTFGRTLEGLGVSLTELRALNPEQQFLKIADAISKVEDPTQRAALAQKAFGGAGRELLPMLALGASGINSLTAEAERLGITLDNQTIAAADELGDSLDIAKLQVHAMAVQVGAAVAGPLTDFLQTMQPIIASMVDFIKTHPEMVKSIAAISAALAVTSVVAIGVGKAFTFLSLHPVVRTIIVLTTAVVALNEAMKALSDWATDTPELRKMKEDLEGARDALAEMDAAVGNKPKPVAPNIDQMQAETLRIQANAEAGMRDLLPTISAQLPSTDITSSIGDKAADGIMELVKLATQTLGVEQGILRAVGGGFVAGVE
ncbi:phage tail tape measure protein [Lacipirellula limnantheis]|uniref:Phage-related minor tail protein n=1 Tax=Lacipirellula limnantheis TaxID=2528024 RepID=A0A517U1B9_9BACT|nr:phage tail tape measure protein [Lacipirellula limnantheis]QDT74426.1 hypothetical protein I41_36220 [Lacipirellula limnantheis]